MNDDQIGKVVTAGVAALRAEARKLGFELSEDAIATVANVLRPLLGFARKFALKSLTITDNRKP